ncbi:MAG: C39 family peptidase [Chloroflexota bacterium]
MNERQQPSVYVPNGIEPPPRVLRWLIGLMISAAVLAVIAIPVGIYAFREWVPPRYQSVYSERFPILQVALPDRPDASQTLPTPVIEATSDIPLSALLGLPAEGATEEAEEAGSAEMVDAATEEMIADTADTEMTEEAAEGDAAVEAQAVVVLPTATENIPPTATATDIPPTATPLPPTDVPQPTAAEVLPVSSSSNAPANARNFGFQYITQTWNNCGPANVTVSLSYYGWREDQSYAESYLRGGREDKNVSPYEIVDFVNEQTQVRSLYRIGGNLDVLKELVAAEFPVMVELGYAPEGNDWLGHYQTVVGYDDSVGSLYVIDTYIPSDQGLPVRYRDFDSDWEQFARTFIVYYPPERESTVMNILGDLSTEEGAYQRVLRESQQAARANPDNPYAWFNLGKAQTYLGQYEAAATAFDQARVKGLPWRMLWYQFEPFEAYFETGRYSDVLALVESNETTLGGGFVEETHYWEGRVLEAQGDRSAAASSFRRALSQNRNFDAAQVALERVS